ncbi:TIGR03757 family integrating conjugative element protein [Aggregatibacter actinomycetemcomitans]|uniref:TIGR03757 family integrating conjugative element protein n=1 Tax=Aggregatibacter actinomycetemcomitans TaxID=714 RepID=UPI00197B090F|nr:TIGR03757 family integrating conjugative element protein [Aggregatibacter actinomycetemcomitans]MBN6058683.1 TIGR03757 family integrating conjugative element protein [Aggregatibacter actinomycetemcomitans]MBN6087192.1 TIGR03757 family integrating conjugative element protein [Aggregatibacter actinomycetemcomitans]
MHINKWFLTLGLISQFVLANSVEIPPSITVYTTQNYSIMHSELANQIYYLDDVEQWEDRISRRLSSNPVQAQLQAQQFFNSPDWVDYREKLKSAYQGVISGWQNGIKKVPAVLFQHPNIESVVVYGETNVLNAEKQWQLWLKQQNR